MFVSREEQIKMGIVTGEPRTYVATPTPTQPQQATLPPQTAIAPVAPIKPSALMDSHNALIGLYREQFKAAAKSGEIVTDNDQSVSYRMSSANELAERRKTARMYLLFLSAVNAMATTGVVGLAYISHMTSSAAQSLAIWLILFGAVQSVLTWRHLQREQTLSPEGLHYEQIQYDAHVHQTDAETRRAAIDYMGRVELERVRLEQSRADAQREAARYATMETRARIAEQMAHHTTPQSTLNRLNTYRPTQQAPQQGPQRPLETHVDADPVWYAIEPDIDAPSADYDATPVVDPVRQCLLNWVSDLYLDYTHDADGRIVYHRMHQDGRLQKGVITPWAQRSSLTATQRRQMDELLRQITPRLFSYDPDRKTWQLNLVRYPRVYMAVDAIDRALTPMGT